MAKFIYVTEDDVNYYSENDVLDEVNDGATVEKYQSVGTFEVKNNPQLVLKKKAK